MKLQEKKQEKTEEVAEEEPQVQIMPDSQYVQQLLLIIVENQNKILSLLGSEKEQ